MHLDPEELGVLVGLASVPHLAPLAGRPRRGVRPLGLQWAIAKGLLVSDAAGPPKVVLLRRPLRGYTGAQPVAKGYNTRLRLTEPGREDTFATDAGWRAICFDSGEPKALSVNLPPIDAHLQAMGSLGDDVASGAVVDRRERCPRGWTRPRPSGPCSRPARRVQVGVTARLFAAPPAGAKRIEG